MTEDQIRTMQDIMRLADMSYWFPKLQAAHANVPRTIMVPTGMSGEELMLGMEGMIPPRWGEFLGDMKKACAEIGYPVFMRTAYLSGKHDWITTCHVPNSESVGPRIGGLVEATMLAGMGEVPIGSAFAVRELLPTNAPFRAFHGMPITQERRVFINDGAVICHHPYWPVESIRNPTDENWKRLLLGLSQLKSPDEDHLIKESWNVARLFEGGWSLDWLNTTNGWYAIDMAPAERSYHWESCKQNIWRGR